jgi:phosphatidylethanolamine-binding protein (PEBP) family uncharacterized protein
MSFAAITDVVPHVLGTNELDIIYGTEHAAAGKHLTRMQAAHAPDVKFDGAPDKHYSLLMVDPDAPSPDDPKMREWLHWVVVNIPGSDVSKGFTMTPYNGPTPPRGTHRYVFLLYEQPEGVTLPKSHIKQRAKFHADKWAKDHKLGDPIGATYFKTAAGA